MLNTKTRLTSIVLCIAFLFAPLLANASEDYQAMRESAPVSVAVPLDIAEALQDLGNAYGSADSATVGEFLASDFLHQGMDKGAFLARLKDNQKYLGKLSIVPTAYSEADGKVTLVAYAVAPIGVLAPSLQLLPLHAGATLVKQEGKWKLRGNQQSKEQPLYKDTTVISADFDPADLDAYKRHIPPGYSMPDKPMVRILFMHWTKMEPPQIPYRLAQLSILVNGKGKSYWHLLSMPETDWFACEAGKSLGFPKYVATIDMTRASDGKRKAGIQLSETPIVDIIYEPDPASKDVYQARRYLSLIFAKNGDAVLTTSTPLSPPQRFKEEFGWMTVNPQNALWREFVKPNSRGAATVVDLSGSFKLTLTTPEAVALAQSRQ